MLLVLAFHGATSALAALQLEASRHVGGAGIGHKLILHYPEGCCADDVVSAVGDGFSEVVHHRYCDPYASAPEPWPVPQNWAWADAARYCTTENFPNEKCWLWWEADVTPIVEGWADRLERRYLDSGRPFMGGYVHGLGGHLNGVAVYPINTANHVSSGAFLARDRPFDMVLSESTTKDNVCEAYDLFFHYPRLSGAQCRVEKLSVVKELIKRGSVVFHGSNDGSLPSLIMGRPLPSIDRNKVKVLIGPRSVGRKVQIADVLYQHDSTILLNDGWRIVPRRTILKQRPLLSDQASDIGADAGVFDLPLSNVECWFNPSIATNGNQSFFVARKWKRQIPNTPVWQSTIVRFNINSSTKQLSNPHQITLADKPGTQWEDPRLMYSNGGWYLGFVQWRHNAKRYVAHQSLALFNEGWGVHAVYHPIFGGNTSSVDIGTRHEKNWLWFAGTDLGLYLVYSFKPHVVAKFSGNRHVEKWQTDNSDAARLWKWGQIRGGSGPTLLPDGSGFLSFFHSSVWWNGRQKRYTMGAYVFDSNPPFRVKAITNEPLLIASEKESRMNGGPLCVFPCGHMLTGNNVLVVYGINDEQCGWMEIGLDKLMSRMKHV